MITPTLQNLIDRLAALPAEDQNHFATQWLAQIEQFSRIDPTDVPPDQRIAITDALSIFDRFDRLKEQ